MPTNTAAVLWFKRTKHCDGCGQPGNYCLCRDTAPCGCRDLHEMGSGLRADAVEVFSEPVPDGQLGLFGEAS